MPAPASTADAAYAKRLQRLSARGGGLRRLLDPQRPYRWNLRRLEPGFVLDVGCGIGRNLKHLDGNGVGIDHNAECVAACREAGLTAYGPDEFGESRDGALGAYDSMLVAHVLEHLDVVDADELVTRYLPFVRAGGRLIAITPQERGQRSDPTHVRFVGETEIREMAGRLDLAVESVRSFPFPRFAGKWFTHNETVSVLRRAGE